MLKSSDHNVKQPSKNKVPIFSHIAEYAILCRVCFKYVYFPYAVATSNPFLFHFHFPYRQAISLQCVDSGIDMRSLTAQHLTSYNSSSQKACGCSVTE